MAVPVALAIVRVFTLASCCVRPPSLSTHHVQSPGFLALCSPQLPPTACSALLWRGSCSSRLHVGVSWTLKCILQLAKAPLTPLLTVSPAPQGSHWTSSPPQLGHGRLQREEVELPQCAGFRERDIYGTGVELGVRKLGFLNAGSLYKSPVRGHGCSLSLSFLSCRMGWTLGPGRLRLCGSVTVQCLLGTRLCSRHKADTPVALPSYWGIGCVSPWC